MATIYLNPTTGDNSRSYAQAQNSATPWQTITYAIQNCTSGDTCIMQDGTYATPSVNVYKEITFTAQNYGSVIVGGTYTNVDIRIDVGGTWTWNGVKFYKVRSSEYGASYGALFVAENGASLITVIFNDCTFEDVELKSYSAICKGSSQLLKATYNRCVFNKIRIQSGYSSAQTFPFWNASTVNDPTTLNNCTFYHNEVTNPLAYISVGILAGKNNIFYCTSSIAWGFGSPTVTYSDFYNVTGSPANTGNITSDPLFVDADNANFNLRPSSPCIGTGTLI